MKDKALLFVTKDLHIGQKIEFKDYYKYVVPDLHGEYSFITNALTFEQIADKYKQNAVIVIKEQGITHRINNVSHDLDVYIGEISKIKTLLSIIKNSDFIDFIKSPQFLLILAMICMGLSIIVKN